MQTSLQYLSSKNLRHRFIPAPSPTIFLQMAVAGSKGFISSTSRRCQFVLGSSQLKVVAYPSVSAIAHCLILQRMISVRNLVALSKTPTSEVLRLKYSSSTPWQVVKSQQSTLRISSNTIQTQGRSPYLRIREHKLSDRPTKHQDSKLCQHHDHTRMCLYKQLGRSPVGSCRGTSIRGAPHRMQETIPENRERHGGI